MHQSHLKPGYVSVLAVFSLSAILVLILTSSFRVALQTQDIQGKAQLRVDYAHREQALLRAVLTQAPNRAMQAMMSDSSSSAWETKNRWRWIFEYARDRADGEIALDNSIAKSLGFSSDVISGNTGDGSHGHIVNNITPTTQESAPHMFYINGGTNSTVLALGEGYPEALVLNDPTLTETDRDRPIITTEKKYSDGSTFKVLPYPNVHFGYAEQGQTFVAKRNWWAFTINYGTTSASVTGVETRKKNYVLSIYEVPSQVALGSTTTTYLGQHSDGTEWSNVNIQGGVYASRAVTQGSIALGSLASREGVQIEDSSSVGGIVAGSTATRETFEAANADFFPLTSSGDSGLVAFIPINLGVDGFDDISNTSDTGSASPTGWNWYSRPAMRAAMQLRVEEVQSSLDQTPVRISFTFLSGGLQTTEFFERGVNWPSESTEEGQKFPFHLEETNSGRVGVAIYAERLAEYLGAAGADPLDINHSLAVNVNYVDSVNATRPKIPSDMTDTCVILRGSKDFTMFPAGFSLVTGMRLYLANDVNVVPKGTDAAGNEVFPPISLFAPEKRFGLRDHGIMIDFKGQLVHLGKDAAAPARLLDLKSGKEETVIPENIQANLFGITNIDQLPPITQMSWLVVIEEVF